jgi:hypothetical protein
MNPIFHKYPQNIWAGEIVKLLKSGQVRMEEGSIIADAPAGSGIISYFVGKSIKDRKIIAVDNDPALLNSAYTRTPDFNLQAELGDIFEFRPEGKNNVWLLVNSLFCLPDKERLVSGKRSQFRYIIAVFPDITSSNYRYFSRKHPEFENPNSMTLENTHDFFASQGYKLIYSKRLAKLSFHSWGKFLSRLRFTPRIRNLFMTLMDKLMFFRNGQYELAVFIRNEENITNI